MTYVLLFFCLLEAVLTFALFVLAIIVFYFMFNSKFMQNPPPIPSDKKIRMAMLDDVSKILSKHKHQTIMDLGSGWGSLLLPLAKKFPHHHFIGIEYGSIPYFISKFRARKMTNIVFYRKDLFTADISKADIIFLFLLTSLMPKIENKCLNEAKKGTLIYANRFPMPNLKPIKETSLGSQFHTYYTYKI